MKVNGGYLISMIARIDDRLLTKMMTDVGITGFNNAQGRILYVLLNHNCIPIKDIAQKTGLAKTTLTSMLKRMEAQNLISYEMDPKDHRSQLISLTPFAKSHGNQYALISKEMNNIFYKGFTLEEVEQCEKYLERIYQNIKEANP